MARQPRRRRGRRSTQDKGVIDVERYRHTELIVNSALLRYKRLGTRPRSTSKPEDPLVLIHTRRLYRILLYEMTLVSLKLIEDMPEVSGDYGNNCAEDAVSVSALTNMELREPLRFRSPLIGLPSVRTRIQHFVDNEMDRRASSRPPSGRLKAWFKLAN